MAQSRNFFGLRRGSTKTMTFQVLHGVQITKDRVYDVANPRTASQMGQRLSFANAVKFFSHGNQALFKFAFEDKKTNESEYNAFMRHNQGESAVASRYMLDYNFPAVGTFNLTAGSLGNLDVKIATTQTGTGIFYLEDTMIDLETMTVGDFWNQFLSAYPQLEDGDIITKVICDNQVLDPIASIAEAKELNGLFKSNNNEGTGRNVKWIITQTKIDTTDIRMCSEADDPVFHFSSYDGEEGLPLYAFGKYGECGVNGVAIIASRVINNQKVLVSNSKITPNPYVQTAINLSRSEDWLQFVTDTYDLSTAGIEADAILKGEIVESNVVFEYTATTNTFTTGGVTAANITKADNVDAEKLVIKVSKDTSTLRVPFAFYEDFGNSQRAVYRNSDETIEIYIPVDGNNVKTGEVKGYGSGTGIGYKLVSIG